MVAQWLSFSGIKLSWLISMAMLFSCVVKICLWKINRMLFGIFAIVCVIPVINFSLGLSERFNITLYVSIITGAVYTLYICILQEEHFFVFVKGAGFSVAIFAFWGAYEVLTGNYIFFNNTVFTDVLNWVGSNYPGVVFANTNDLAQYLVMLFPITTVGLLNKKKGLYVMVALVSFFVIFHTASKLSMISFVITLLTAYLLKLFMTTNANAFIKGIFLGVLALILLCIVNLYTGVLDNIFQNFLVVKTDADYYTGRSAIYVNLVNAGLTLPFGGFGSAYSIQEMPPHNLFLYILCDYGWMVAILFVLLLLKLLKDFYKSAKANIGDMVPVFMIASLCVFPLMSSVSSCNEQRKIIWLVLGIYIKSSMIYKRKDVMVK